MQAKDFLQKELEDHVGRAKSITDDAEAQGRNLTDEERDTVKDALAKATELKGRISEMEQTETMRKSIDDLTKSLVGEPEEVKPEEARDIGAAFVSSQGFKALQERGTAGRWSTGPVSINLKANTGFVAFTEGQNADLRDPQVLPGIQGPVEERLTIAALLGQGTATSNTIKYVKETVTTNAAASVAEGDAKPPSVIGFDAATASLVKIATILTTSDEMLEDVDQMRSYLNNRLALFIRQEEEDQILNGAGGANLDGLINQAANNVAGSDIGGDNFFDGIMAGITTVRIESGLEPDGVVMHPMDFARLSVTRDTANGGYFSGGPYAGPERNPWGLRTVVTTAIDEGHFLVGAFRQGATLWRKGGLTVEATNSHEDYFQRNLVALRAETRVALTVYRAQAFALVREGS